MSEASRQGRLIAVCGIDGSGKNTQTERLAQRTEQAGRTVHIVSFPRYGTSFFGELIERYLRGEFAGRASDVDPYMAALPYACDRWEASAQLRTWLEDGCLVLCNRYVPANQAHQGCKLPAGEDRTRFLNWINELEYRVFALPRPDMHVLLDVPPAVAVRLLKARDAERGLPEGHDIHESDAQYLEATAGVYRQLAAADPSGWRVVGCTRDGAMLPQETISQLVWDHVQPVLYTEV